MNVSLELQPYKDMALLFDVVSITVFLIALFLYIIYIIKVIIEKKKTFNVQSVSYLSWSVGLFSLFLLAMIILGSNGLSSLIKNEYFYLTTLSLFGVMLGSCSLWIFRFVARLSGLKFGGVFNALLLSVFPLIVFSMGIAHYVIGAIVLIALILLVVFVMARFQEWLERKGNG